MSAKKIKAVTKVLAASATALHDGTNAPGHKYLAENMIIQNEGGADVFIGESDVSGASNGWRIDDGLTVNVAALLSRGTTDAFDLREIYYIGGPFTLVFLEEAN